MNLKLTLSSFKVLIEEVVSLVQMCYKILLIQMVIVPLVRKELSQMAIETPVQSANQTNF